ncbi:MAG: DUF1538 domain-containing protein [Spirochaetaceae bacterium]|jgi:hypothetical protein|nr:DUF1538 domain-containing protein [Spirochaetaceae bacterium]
MNKILYEKIMEAFSSVLPITGIVLLTSIVLTPIPAGELLMFIVGAAMLIIGMGFFTMGADMAMMPMGEGIGIQLTKTPNLFVILSIAFLMGVIITIAEPDLQVLARLVPSIEPSALIITVGAGVGFFLVISVLRTLFKIPLSLLLIISYAITFAAAYFTPSSFLPLAFDSGGVTTGPITVPFILALGVGVASIRGDKGSQEDSFGLVSLCSVGPILAVLLLGVFYNPSGAQVESAALVDVSTSRDVALQFTHHMPDSFKEVLQALCAIILFFVVFQLISRRFKKHQVRRMTVGFLYTLIGLVVFLTGVNVGFIPAGQRIGEALATSNIRLILIPFSMIVGYFIVSAEPAVHVLTKQVEDISAGAIPQKTLRTGLAVGMSAALALSMSRILLHIPIMYILIPGYITAIVLTFFVPKIFTGIAFDSGGVCSGPLTSTFLLPFAMGACRGSGGDLMLEAFGIVAMVAMTPLIVIQIIGVFYNIKLKSMQSGGGTARAGGVEEIIEYEGAGLYA